MIHLERVHKAFGEKAILRDISFSVPKGEVVGLLGPNGAGKTTLIRLMNGVITPDRGSVRVFGLDPASQGSDIRGRCGVVTESAGMYPDMSAKENLEFFAKLYDCEDPARIAALLERFQLAEHGDKLVGAYSTGMKKRLAIAKAMLHEPELLFLDEPTNGLDPEGIRDMIGFLKQLNKEQGTTILICSHVLYQLEEVCSAYLFLEQGLIIEQGALPALEEKYAETVRLEVETGYMTEGDAAAGYPFERLSADRLLFSLPSKRDIPVLLRHLLQHSWVYSSTILNRDLESVYFEVRRRFHES